MQIIFIYSTIAILVFIKNNFYFTSYCFNFSNIYLKIFFMIKVCGCERKRVKKKTSNKMKRLLLERILQCQAYQYQLSFFSFKKYFCFSKPELDLDKYFFKSLFSSL